MLTNLLFFLMGMLMMYFLSYLLSLGHSIIVIKNTQHSCAIMFVEMYQGLHEILELKYLTMQESNRSKHNVKAQKHIDGLNIKRIKKSIMNNYVDTFPASYEYLMEFQTWEELENYVNKFAQAKKERQ